MSNPEDKTSQFENLDEFLGQPDDLNATAAFAHVDGGTIPGSSGLGTAGAANAAAVDAAPAPEGGLGAAGSGIESLKDATTAQESVAEEEKEKKPKKPGLFSKLSKTSPYTILLLLAFDAMVIACLVLYAEWASYKFTTKPQSIRKAISSAPVQAGPARTTAVA